MQPTQHHGLVKEFRGQILSATFQLTTISTQTPICITRIHVIWNLPLVFGQIKITSIIIIIDEWNSYPFNYFVVKKNQYDSTEYYPITCLSDAAKMTFTFASIQFLHPILIFINSIPCNITCFIGCYHAKKKIKMDPSHKIGTITYFERPGSYSRPLPDKPFQPVIFPSKMTTIFNS